MLDTFEDGQRGYELFANPLGVQMDLIQDDVARRRGRVLGHPLELGRPADSRGLRGGDGDSVLEPALPAPRRSDDLGDRRGPGAPARLPGALRRLGPPTRPQLHPLPVRQARRRRGPAPATRTSSSPPRSPPSGPIAAASSPDARMGGRRVEGGSRPHRALGDHPRLDASSAPSTPTSRRWRPTPRSSR